MYHIWMFPKIGVPQNGWFIVENPIKMDDLGGFPIFFGNTHIGILVHHLPCKVKLCRAAQLWVIQPSPTWRYTWRMLVLLPWPLSMMNSIWWQQTVCPLLLPRLFVGLQLIEVSCLHRTHHLTPRDPGKVEPIIEPLGGRGSGSVEASCKNTSHFYMYCVRWPND